MKPRAEGESQDDEAVARMLDRVPLEDPPADLRQNVLRAIGSRPEPARQGWFETFRSELRERFFAGTIPFAAGAAAGVIVFALASGSGLWRGTGSMPSDGAMAPLVGGTGSVAGGGAGPKVDDQRFELGRANVRFEVFRSKDRAVVAVQADAADPVLVTIELPPGTSRVERLVTVPSSRGGVEYGPGWVRISQSGRDRAEIGLVVGSGAGDAPIRIADEAAGGTVRGALRASAAPPADGPSVPKTN
jgi:hypothetical protein